MRDIVGILSLAIGAALTAISKIYPPTSRFWHVVLYVSIGLMVLIVSGVAIRLLRTRSWRMIGIDALIVLCVVGLVTGVVLRIQYLPFGDASVVQTSPAKPLVAAPITTTSTSPSTSGATSRQYSNRSPKQIISLQSGITPLQAARLTDP